jgi:hypothetical protein
VTHTCLIMFATWTNLFRSCSTLKTSNIPMVFRKQKTGGIEKRCPHSPWDRPESRSPAVQGCQSARWHRPWRTSVAPGGFDLWFTTMTLRVVSVCDVKFNHNYSYILVNIDICIWICIYIIYIYYMNVIIYICCML